jgi:hypothetical protein
MPIVINPSDILHLPFTPDLTKGGIECACRFLGSSSHPRGGLTAAHLRQLVGGMAAELAFRRSLTEQAIPFQVLGAMPFTHPDRYEVSLGGHHCKLECAIISRRSQITRLRKDPALVLDAPALIPVEEFSSEGHRPGDVHIFAFLLGLETITRAEIDKALAAGQPACLIHPLPEGWSCPSEWLPLEKLALKSDCDLPVTIGLGGQNSEREFCTARVELPPRKRVGVERCFHSLGYLHSDLRPDGRIGLHSPARGDALIISPYEWNNIWVYGMKIILMGWLSHEDYRRKAKVLNAGMHTFQVERTHEKNLFVPMEELNPLRPLYKHIQAWAVNP